MKIKKITKGVDVNTRNKSKKFCKYVDTDSIFYPIEPLFNYRYGGMDEYSDDEILEKSRPIINDVQDFINKSYNIYSRKYHNITDHRWEIKQEYVAKRAFWVGKLNSKTKKVEGVKKRYAQLIVEKEGFKTEFMDVKGLDVVRSSFPTAFRDFMNEILIDILNDKSKESLNEKVQKYKSTVNNCNYKDIMAPSGITDITKYTMDGVGNRKSGTPVHVKAALSYNDLMTMNNITNIPTINDGDKILWSYVGTNKYGFNEVALKGFEDPEVIEKFVEANIDRTKMFERLLLKKISNFWLSLGWDEIQLNPIGNKFFNF